ncbi:MAG: phospholipase D-like domain-containing protein [Candidatus Saccharimonadaceae bacterium]
MKLLSPTQYIREATEAVNYATTRVYLLSMVIADHQITHPLIVALENAAKRGVQVVVAADIFTYGEVSDGFMPFRYYSRGARDTSRMVRNLKHAGASFHWLGRSRITLYSGRTHSKWCVVDDTVFTFGGVNLYNEGVQNMDFMFRLEDSKLADRIIEEQIRVQKAENSSKNYHSVIYERKNMTVLIDGGIIGQSVIYRRAVELAEQAVKITFVSQYCPNGKLSRVFKKKEVTLYFNRPLQADGLNRLVIRIGQFLTGLKTSYKRARYLHAKCIIYTFEDGSKAAITGSHNFAYTGVLLGTREIALETRDPKVIEQIEKFIKTEVA